MLSNYVKMKNEWDIGYLVCGKWAIFSNENENKTNKFLSDTKFIGSNTKNNENFFLVIFGDTRTVCWCYLFHFIWILLKNFHTQYWRSGREWKMKIVTSLMAVCWLIGLIDSIEILKLNFLPHEDRKFTMFSWKRSTCTQMHAEQIF